MTREEAFKIQSYKLRGSGAIIRHHNPAFEGIMNSAFVDEPDHFRYLPRNSEFLLTLGLTSVAFVQNSY